MVDEQARPRTITITWRAFKNMPTAVKSRNPETHATVTFVTDLDDLALCEAVFEATNLYQGALWDAIEPVLPPDRTHTALSVIADCGDYVTVDGVCYEVAPFGFNQVDQ